MAHALPVYEALRSFDRYVSTCPYNFVWSYCYIIICFLFVPIFLTDIVILISYKCVSYIKFKNPDILIWKNILVKICVSNIKILCNLQDFWLDQHHWL